MSRPDPDRRLLAESAILPDSLKAILLSAYPELASPTAVESFLQMAEGTEADRAEVRVGHVSLPGDHPCQLVRDLPSQE